MRSKKIIYTAIAVVLFNTAAMVSCTHNTSTGDITPGVSFRNDIIPILRTSCALNSDCHSGAQNTGDNMDFDSSAAYSTMINKQLVNTTTPTASLLYVEVSTGTMPKSPYRPLSSSQISLLLNWIKQGAQNN